MSTRRVRDRALFESSIAVLASLVVISVFFVGLSAPPRGAVVVAGNADTGAGLPEGGRSVDLAFRSLTGGSGGAGAVGELWNLSVTVDFNSSGIGGSTVNVTNLTDGRYAVGTTNTSGVYTASGLESGTYMIEATAQLPGISDRISGQEDLNLVPTSGTNHSDSITLALSTPQPKALTVQILSTNGTCPYTHRTLLYALVAGGLGNGSYSYRWFVNGTSRGDQPTLSLPVESSGNDVNVTVSSQGRWLGTYSYVNTSTSPHFHLNGSGCGEPVRLGPMGEGSGGKVSLSWDGKAGYVLLVNRTSSVAIVANLTFAPSGPGWSNPPQNLTAFMGAMTPWWQLSITNPEGYTAPLDWIAEPSQSSQVIAEFNSTVLLHPRVGDKIDLSFSPTGNLALAADLVTLAYETLGVIDPIQTVDRDPGFMAELIQTEAIGLAQQLTLTELESGFSGNLLDLESLLNTAIPWVLSDVATLPLLLEGVGSVYLTQYLRIPFSSFNATMVSAINTIGSDLASTGISGFGYGTLAYQSGLFVGALDSNTTLAPFNITSIDYQNSTSCQDSCGGGGGGFISSSSQNWSFILVAILILLAIVAIVWSVIAKGHRSRR